MEITRTAATADQHLPLFHIEMVDGYTFRRVFLHFANAAKARAWARKTWPSRTAKIDVNLSA